jgi:hypothetical protein
MDSIVKSIIDRFETRAEMGNKKYGTDLDRKDLTPLEWVQHLQDELHDAYLYSEKLKVEYIESIKQLMSEWIKEKKLHGASVPVEAFAAGFYVYLLEKKHENSN